EAARPVAGPSVEQVRGSRLEQRSHQGSAIARAFDASGKAARVLGVVASAFAWRQTRPKQKGVELARRAGGEMRDPALLYVYPLAVRSGKHDRLLHIVSCAQRCERAKDLRFLAAHHVGAALA